MAEETPTEGWFSEDAATFGDRLAGAREAMGMSQSELARRLGVKLKTVTGWEDDLIEPRANKLQMLAGMLNVSIMWLLTGRGEGLEGPVEADGLNAGAEKLLADLRKARTDAIALGDRIGRLEKALRKTLKENAG
ncbi:helix-turn-helix domain-containing protein [Acidimangrovimonas pyrenivorans]|uniref:Multiprotein-bridging factor 1 family protein n=1 Tax=Acidimangrovimonas pyrenivorans TaxID=2030798 RepID=A0ABV7AD03_9RHOB